MLEYLPWSQKTFNESLKEYYNGKFTILDIELGGQCNYHCIYCDSPCRDKKCVIDQSKIEEVFQTQSIKWVFVCGLGEPTAPGNLELLLNILKLCDKYNAKCSIFTNLSILNVDIEKYIRSGTLNILFKYDTSDFTKAMSIYGVSHVTKQLFNIQKLKEIAKNDNGYTNIAASIVPTKINKDEIDDIVQDCIANNIYPLIAELEDSGSAQDYYEQLALSDEELNEIKKRVNELIGNEYIIPVCPAVICGIHIRHDGNVTVDEYSGLSCHWFWLKEPKTKIIKNFNNTPIEDIIDEIQKYRKERIESVKKILKETKRTVFGGCGGDIVYLLNRYLEITGE